MPGIPSRRDPLPGSRLPSQVLGRNVEFLRRVRRASQTNVALRMEYLGHKTWVRQTVAQVERAARHITADELVSLAVALQTSASTLLDPAGLEPGSVPTPIDVGTGSEIPYERARLLIHDFGAASPLHPNSVAFHWSEYDGTWTEAGGRLDVSQGDE